MTLKIEQKVKKRQFMVADLMMIFVTHITSKDEETKETVMKTAKDIEDDFEELHKCALRTVVFYGV